MNKEQNIIVTFSHNNDIHHYKGIRGLKPMSPYTRHNSVEDAKEYLINNRGVNDPKVIEK